jgi:hypothetical protein
MIAHIRLIFFVAAVQLFTKLSVTRKDKDGRLCVKQCNCHLIVVVCAAQARAAIHS